MWWIQYDTYDMFQIKHTVWMVEAYLKDLQYDYKLIFSLNADFRAD